MNLFISISQFSASRFFHALIVICLHCFFYQIKLKYTKLWFFLSIFYHSSCIIYGEILQLNSLTHFFDTNWWTTHNLYAIASMVWCWIHKRLQIPFFIYIFPSIWFHSIPLWFVTVVSIRNRFAFVALHLFHTGVVPHGIYVSGNNAWNFVVAFQIIEPSKHYGLYKKNVFSP